MCSAFTWMTGCGGEDPSSKPPATLPAGTPVILIAPMGSQRQKAISNLKEVQARGAYVIVVHTEGDDELADEGLSEMALALEDAVVAEATWTRWGDLDTLGPPLDALITRLVALDAPGGETDAISERIGPRPSSPPTKAARGSKRVISGCSVAHSELRT